MANYTLSTNMSLPIPTVGVDPGPDYANNLNSALTIVDAHDHTSGSGVKITPSAININSDLSLNGFNLTAIKETVFNSQAAVLSGTNFLSFVGGNLYVNDGAGNQIQITSGGSVVGASGN